MEPHGTRDEINIQTKARDEIAKCAHRTLGLNTESEGIRGSKYSGSYKASRFTYISRPLFESTNGASSKERS